MLTITILKGLPGSGKSTLAKQMVLDSQCGMKRVNKDDIRAMLDAGKHTKGNEAMVLELRDHIILTALRAGKHVVVDDTNFEPRHLAAIEALAEVIRAEKGSCNVAVRFIDTPLEECIARDNARPNGVGERVIRTMYNKYLRPEKAELVPLVQDETLPRAIIVDIDGTLAKMHDRGPFEWSKVGQDLPHDDIAWLVRKLREHHQIIFMSGRDAVCRPETMAWIEQHVRMVPLDAHLLMRPEGNMEKDSVVKERLFREQIAGKYYVAYVIDDRDQVVRMWRNIGLRCLQVADGDF